MRGAGKLVLAAPWGGRLPARPMSTSAPASENAIIKTTYGDLTLSFWTDVAPKTVENF